MRKLNTSDLSFIRMVYDIGRSRRVLEKAITQLQYWIQFCGVVIFFPNLNFIRQSCKRLCYIVWRQTLDLRRKIKLLSNKWISGRRTEKISRLDKVKILRIREMMKFKQDSYRCGIFQNSHPLCWPHSANLRCIVITCLSG